MRCLWFAWMYILSLMIFVISVLSDVSRTTNIILYWISGVLLAIAVFMPLMAVLKYISVEIDKKQDKLRNPYNDM